jgi:hypothetical protein
VSGYCRHDVAHTSRCNDCDEEQSDARIIAAAPSILAENERLRDALRRLIDAARLEGFTEERSDDPLSIALDALKG